MIWNIQFQLAGLIIAIICAYFCAWQKRLNFIAERHFLRLISAVILSIALDIMSVIAISARTSLGDFGTKIICEAYIVSIVFVAYCAFGFSCSDIDSVQQGHLGKLMLIPMLVQIAIIAVFGIEIYDDGFNVYTHGVSVLATYFICFFYIVCAVIVVFLHKAFVSARKRYVLLGWCAATLLAATIQFFNNELLLISFSMAMSCMYMYIKLQNPEYNLDLDYYVFNRKAFFATIEEGEKTKRHKAVISFEVFNMNSIKEIFGNKTMTMLVAEICNYAKSINDITEFKLADNMFCLIVSENERVEAIVEQLERRFSEPWEVNETQVSVKAGIVYIWDAQSIGNAEEIEEVLHFFSNQLKKDNLSYMEVDDKALLSRKRSLEVQHALDWALSHDGVEVFYQPIYGIKQGRFTAMEALVRIRDEKGNLIMPGEFVEFAEQNGMILKLGEEIFRKVCQFIRQNKITEYGLEYIEVNLSVVQCMQDDLAKHFTDMMGEYQISPHLINFEITETAAINTRESLESNMEAFIKYGNTFSLDDYGSGYSNLTYIVEMPLKIIKIDRSLAIAYDVSEKAKAAIEYTVEMVHNIGMEIVVEGIETEEQYMNFKKLGVEFIQGYYFAKPQPADKVLDYITAWL